MQSNDAIFSVWREKYLLGSHELRYELISNFNQECQTRKDYLSRELLEIIQNADDQQSETLHLSLRTGDNDPCLVVTNSGDKTKIFTRDGFRAIMMPNSSSKTYCQTRVIGEKGLGFRSLLNWSTNVEIRSAGVHCRFSEEQANKVWQKEIEGLGNEDFKNKCRLALEKANADGRMRSCVVPILAVPEVEDDNVYTEQNHETEIIIHFGREKIQTIKSQLEALTPTVLLFLNHLTKIEIRIDDQNPRQLSRGNWVECENFHKVNVRKCSLCDSRESADRMKWIIMSSSVTIVNDGVDKVSIAWREDGTPVPNDQRYVYTFFKTGVRLNLPCLVHATFRLDSSRNQVLPLEANKTISRVVGKCLVCAAEWIACRLNEQNVLNWQPVSMCTVPTELNASLEEIRAGINDAIGDAAIYPTVGGVYRKRAEIVQYGEDMATFCLRYASRAPFRNHLIPGLQSYYGTPFETEDNSFADSAEKFVSSIATSREHDDVKFRVLAEFLQVLLKLFQNRTERRRMIACLIDESGQVVPSNEDAFVCRGRQLVDVPACLGIRYMNSKLVENLKSCLNVDDRQLVDLLSRFCSVKSSDITSMKNRIVSFSKNYSDRNGEITKLDCFQQIVKCLFKTYTTENEGRTQDEGLGAAIDLEFQVLDSQKRSCPAHEVSLWDETQQFGLASMVGARDVDPKWKLYNTLQEWCTYLDCNDSEIVTRFLCEFLNIGKGIPKRRVPSGDDTAYIRGGAGDGGFEVQDFSEARLSGRASNYSMVLNEAFLQEQVENTPPTLSDAYRLVGLIESDADATDAILKPQTLSYFRNQVRTKIFSTSYACYLLKRSGLFQGLSYYVVKEDISATGERLLSHTGLSFERHERIKALLCKIGAARTLEDMQVEDLYRLLAKYNEQKQPHDVQKFYRTIRQALMHHIESSATPEERESLLEKCEKLAKDNLRKLFARKGKNGPLELIEINSVYYWDNDGLSRDILDRFYKLEIGGRVGEISVSRLFGVRRVRRECVTVISKETVEGLSNQLADYLISRRPYLLATRFQDRDSNLDAIKNAVSTIADINFEVVRSCSYTVDNVPAQMREGDLLAQDNGQFIICSHAATLEKALTMPRFCAPIAEALCIAFQLTGSQVSIGFRSVLKNSDEENEYYRQSEVDSEKWERIQDALGLSAAEQEFWRLVFGRTVDLSQKMASLSLGGRHRIETIQSIPESNIPNDLDLLRPLEKFTPDEIYRLIQGLHLTSLEECGSIITDSLLAFSQSKLCTLRDEMKDHFAVSLHKSLRDKEQDEIATYCEKLSDYIHATDWLKSATEEVYNSILNSDLDNIVAKALNTAVQTRFRVTIMNTNESAPLCTEKCLTSLSARSIDINEVRDSKIRSLAYFTKTEDAFVSEFNRIQGANNEISDVATDTVISANDVNDRPILVSVTKLGEADQKVSRSKYQVVKSLSGGRTGYATSKELRKLGLRAENTVREMMKDKPDLFGSPKPWSSLTENSGLSDDNRHYDFEYTNDKGEKRFLEVKAFHGGRFLMSAAEYEFATTEEHCSRYDLALVDGKRVHLLQAPFHTPELKQGIVVSPDTWSIKLKIEKTTDGMGNI